MLPEECVPIKRCGTHAPSWIRGSHPRPEDGVVTRQVCSHWFSNCCNWRGDDIQVKACPGGYYVYKLQQLKYCFLAYCVGKFVHLPDTIIISLNG